MEQKTVSGRKHKNVQAEENSKPAHFYINSLLKAVSFRNQADDWFN